MILKKIYVLAQFLFFAPCFSAEMIDGQKSQKGITDELLTDIQLMQLAKNGRTSFTDAQVMQIARYSKTIQSWRHGLDALLITRINRARERKRMENPVLVQKKRDREQDRYHLKRLEIMKKRADLQASIDNKLIQEGDVTIDDIQVVKFARDGHLLFTDAQIEQIVKYSKATKSWKKGLPSWLIFKVKSKKNRQARVGIWPPLFEQNEHSVTFDDIDRSSISKVIAEIEAAINPSLYSTVALADILGQSLI